MVSLSELQRLSVDRGELSGQPPVRQSTNQTCMVGCPKGISDHEKQGPLVMVNGNWETHQAGGNDKRSRVDKPSGDSSSFCRTTVLSPRPRSERTLQDRSQGPEPDRS